MITRLIGKAAIILAGLLVSTLPITMAQDGENNSWGIEVVGESGVLASVNGRINRSNRLNILLDREQCGLGETWFEVSSTRDNPGFLSLEGQDVLVMIDDRQVRARIRETRTTTAGHAARVYLGYKSTAVIEKEYEGLDNVRLEMTDSESIQIKDYFDAAEYEWSLAGFQKSLQEATLLCEQAS